MELIHQRKKGYYFSIDVIIAVSIIFIVLLIVPYLYIKGQPTSNMQFIATDIANLLSDIKVSEINNSFLIEQINASNITRLNNSLLEQVGEFWALGQMGLARAMVLNITAGIIPENLNFGIWADGDEIYKKGGNATRNLVSVNRLISGIEKTKPVRGELSRAYLSSLGNKRTSAIKTFGGFIGQGNITGLVLGIPKNATIREIVLELDVISDFNLYINNISCLGVFTSNKKDMIVDEWHITNTNCLNAINTNKDKNYFKLAFQNTNLSGHYIGGGLIKVNYDTKNMITFDATSDKWNYLPGIDGFINYFSSIYVPGRLNYINASLHMKTNYTVFFSIGNTPIVNSYTTKNLDKTLVLRNSNFSSKLNYLNISEKTIPIRLGTGNVTGGTGVGDVILITDLSGSMDTNIVPGKTRIQLAKELDAKFAKMVLNLSGNRVGLVTYSENGAFSHSLSTNFTSLNKTIKTYTASGSTCIACAVRAARQMLTQESKDPKRKRFIVVMTDGIANVQASQTNLESLKGCDVQFNIFKWKWCSKCVTTGCYVYSSSCGDNYDPFAVQHAIDDSCRARTKVNSTNYAIGFANACDVANQTLSGIATCGQGSYYSGTNPGALETIYSRLALGILNASYNSQTIDLLGNIKMSYLYPDSYIYLNYTPTSNTTAYGKISVTFQSPKFNTCEPTFNVSTNVEILKAEVTSYSGSHWTDLLSLNNSKTNKDVYTLRDGSFGQKYTVLGDPFIVNVPASSLVTGTNNKFKIGIGDNRTKHMNCSLNNSIIYTLQVPNSGEYSEVLPKSEGCKWTIESDDGSSIVVPVPSTYSGNKTCNYGTHTYDHNDSIDVAVNSLLQKLDFDNDGKIYINLEAGSLEINALSVLDAPSLWGPAVVEVRLWI